MLGSSPAASPRDRIAVAITVRNEAATLDVLLASLEAQTWQPSEVLLVDGGSTDGTLERLRAWSPSFPVRVLSAPGANISRGRNLAFAACSSEWVAVTDAGVRASPDWLAELARARDGADVVSGFFVPDPHTAFETAMGATVLPALSDIRPDRFLPSSRSVLLRRAAWERVGGYPEWLDYCEDLVFDLRLRRAGVSFRFAPAAVVCFRPRSSLWAFLQQYFRYARGDGKANLWPRRHLARYSAYVALVVLLRLRPLGWVLAAAGGAAYLRRPVARLAPRLRGMRRTEQAYAVAMIPVIRLVGDVAKMLGYPAGWAWRLARRPPSW